MYVKRQVAKAPSPGAMDIVDDAAFAKEYPALLEHLAMSTWEDGSARKLSTMSISVQEGRWSVCIVDKANNQLAFLSGSSFKQLLTSLEKKLSTDTLEWRACKKWGKGSS